MKLEDTGAIMLSPYQFMKKVGLKPDCWLIEELLNSHYSRCWMYEAAFSREVREPERYFFSNGEVIREFKHMKEYGETWIRVFDMTAETPSWSIWSVWKEGA